MVVNHHLVNAQLSKSTTKIISKGKEVDLRVNEGKYVLSARKENHKASQTIGVKAFLSSIITFFKGSLQEKR